MIYVECYQGLIQEIKRCKCIKKESSRELG